MSDIYSSPEVHVPPKPRAKGRFVPPIELLDAAAQKTIKAEYAIRESQQGEYDAGQNFRARNRGDRLYVAVRLKDLDPAEKEAIQECRDDDARLAAEVPAYEAERKTINDLRAGSAIQAIEQQILGTTILRTHDAVRVNTKATLKTGEKSPADAAERCRNTIKLALNEQKTLGRSGRPRTEAKAVIVRAVARAAKAFSYQLGAANHVSEWNDQRQRFETRELDWPTIGVPNGIGGINQIPNALAVMCALDPEGMVEALLNKAREGRDESNDISLEDRTARMKELDWIIVATEYEAEFWHRQCVRAGINGGPRCGANNAAAVLDLRFEPKAAVPKPKGKGKGKLEM